MLTNTSIIKTLISLSDWQYHITLHFYLNILSFAEAFFKESIYDFNFDITFL